MEVFIAFLSKFASSYVAKLVSALVFGGAAVPASRIHPYVALACALICFIFTLWFFFLLTVVVLKMA